MPTLQKSIGSRFGAASTAADVIKGIDHSGHVAIVKGGYSGIGLETTRASRSAGAKVIVPARDLGKVATALKGLDVMPYAVDPETADRRWKLSEQLTGALC
jgi:short-subunit dehydrogenase involved in D-alanine esterification of teichoic acids